MKNVTSTPCQKRSVLRFSNTASPIQPCSNRQADISNDTFNCASGVVKQTCTKQDIIEREYAPTQALSDTAEQERWDVNPEDTTVEELLNCVPPGLLKQRWIKQEIVEREYVRAIPPGWTQQEAYESVDDHTIAESTDGESTCASEPGPAAWAQLGPAAWAQPAPAAWAQPAPAAWAQPAPVAWAQPAPAAWAQPGPAAWAQPQTVMVPQSQDVCPVSNTYVKDPEASMEPSNAYQDDLDTTTVMELPGDYGSCSELALLLSLILMGFVVVGEKDGVRTFVFADSNEESNQDRRQWERPETQCGPGPAAWAKPAGAAWAQPQTVMIPQSQNVYQGMGSTYVKDPESSIERSNAYQFNSPAALRTKPTLRDLVHQGGIYASSIAQQIMNGLSFTPSNTLKMLANRMRAPSARFAAPIRPRPQSKGLPCAARPVPVPRPLIPPHPIRTKTYPPGHIIKVAAPRFILKSGEALPSSIAEPKVTKGSKSHSEFRRMMYPQGVTLAKGRLTINDRGLPDFVPISHGGNVKMVALEKCDSYKRFNENIAREPGQCSEQCNDQLNQRVYDEEDE